MVLEEEEAVLFAPGGGWLDMAEGRWWTSDDVMAVVCSQAGPLSSCCRAEGRF